MSKEIYQDARDLVLSSLEVSEVSYNKAVAAMSALGTGTYPELYQQLAGEAEIEARKIGALRFLDELLIRMIRN